MEQPFIRWFPQMREAIEATGGEFARETRRVHLPSGHFVCMEGQACGQLALLVDGSVRVYKSGESGREITLYRISSGGSCILTASCILNHRAFPAFAVTESEVTAYAIPASTFLRWVTTYTPWQHYVFELLSQRLESVIEIVEEVAFRRMDVRLADFLLETAAQSGSTELAVTHERIASELGSSREVVSRLLKEFEREGLLSLGRGQIRLEAHDKLKQRREPL